MSDFRSLSGNSREPTYADRARMEQLRAGGVEDVYCEVDAAPAGFWANIVQLTGTLELHPVHWSQWLREFAFANGLDSSELPDPEGFFDAIIRLGPSHAKWNQAPTRLSAVELLLDLAGDVRADSFADRLNERARWWRVGVRLEGRRFVSVTSEHMHTEVVQPVLLLLSDATLDDANGLYRKAFERALTKDYAGAISAASSAVEDMLRLGLGVEGMTMDQLAGEAKKAGWINPAAHQFAVKLYALRMDSDAHTAGTDDYNVASGRCERCVGNYTTFEGTSEIQRLVIARAISGVHIR